MLVYCASLLAASHHWSASGSWHMTWWNILLLQRSLCQTLWILNWLLILLTARTTQKTLTGDFSSGSRMPCKYTVFAPLASCDFPRTCCQLLHLRHTWNVCSQSVGSWQWTREICWLKDLTRESCWNEPEILCTIQYNTIQYSFNKVWQNANYTIHGYKNQSVKSWG